MSSTINALVEELDEQYPDTINAIKDLDDKERIAYIAKRELIDHIKLINEKG